MNPTLRALCLVLAALIVGQASIFAILPPLGRELGFSEVSIGLIVTLSSGTAFLVSPWWGRRVGPWGPRRVLMTALVGSSACFFAMAGITALGLSGIASTTQALVLMLAVRGVVFGVFLAAGMVAIYGAVSALTATDKERIAGFALVQVAYGVGNVTGPLVGGFLAGFGFVLALATVPLLTLGGLILVLTIVPVTHGDPTPQSTTRLSPLDPRIFPYLVIIFVALIPMAVSLITLGFVMQDRLNLDAADAARMAGFAVFTVFAGMAAVQLVVRRLDWSAGRLVRVGVAVSMVAMAGIALIAATLPLFLCMAAVGVGVGLAQTGALAAPTLAVRPDEQGALSGLLASTNTFAFAVGPVSASALYAINGALPYFVAAGLLAMLLLALSFSPRFAAVGKSA